MLTLFTTTKAFVGQTAVIQRNALRSWRALGEDCHIIVFGDEPGTGEVCREIDALHVPDVDVTSRGTPLLGCMFERAEKMAWHDRLCFVNADIIFLPDLLEAVSVLSEDQILFVGQRWDVLIEKEWDFGARDYAGALRRWVREHGRLHRPNAMDYFVFRKGQRPQMRDFAVGRAGWDNWFLQACLQRGMTVIDATDAISCIHQAHNYGHIPGGKREAWFGPEALRNRSRAFLWDPLASIGDAQMRLTANRKVRPARQFKHLWRRLERSLARVGALYATYRFLRRACFASALRIGRAYRRLRGVEPNPVNDPWSV